MSIVEGEYCTWAQSPNMGFSTELASTEVFSHCNMVIIHSELYNGASTSLCYISIEI